MESSDFKKMISPVVDNGFDKAIFLAFQNKFNQNQYDELKECVDKITKDSNTLLSIVKMKL